MTATLKDVAELAGVSEKSVSNVVLNRTSKVSPRTLERVRQAIITLNYQPNLAARHLRKTRLGVIALAIPDISNPYFSSIGTAVIETAEALGYTVLIDHTSGQRDKEALVANGLRPHMIDGVILSPLSLVQNDILPDHFNIPTVLLGERVFGSPYDHVAIDNVAAARLATNHLLSLGRRRIAAIGVPDDVNDIMPRMRLQGYTEALLAANLDINPAYIVTIPPASFTRIDGANAIKELIQLSPPPDAVFCFNDLVALGAIRALHAAGYRVPEDIAVIGFDDIEEGQYSTPTLTTIAPAKKEIASLAVTLLHDRIEGVRTGPAQLFQPAFTLIERESTGVKT